jgi:hypothetical protein
VDDRLQGPDRPVVEREDEDELLMRERQHGDVLVNAEARRGCVAACRSARGVALDRCSSGCAARRRPVRAGRPQERCGRCAGDGWHRRRVRSC